MLPPGLPLGSADAPFFNERGYEVAKFCCLTVRALHSHSYAHLHLHHTRKQHQRYAHLHWQQRRKGHVRRFLALELHVTTAAAPSGQAITHPFRVYIHKGTFT